MTETSTLDRIATGEDGAVRECIDRYGNLVWSLARRMAPTTAEDAAREIFIDLWKNAKRFDPRKASERAFIAAIARRRLMGRRPPMPSRPEPRAETHPATLRGSEASSAGSYLRELLPEERQVILLAVAQGMSHQEIAGTTDLAIDTVKSHIHRGLVKVRASLAPGRRHG